MYFMFRKLHLDMEPHKCCLFGQLTSFQFLIMGTLHAKRGDKPKFFPS